MNSREHFWHYLLLILILLAGFVGFVYFKQSPSFRFFSLFGSILGYIVWGVWHHFVEGRLTWSVITEYLLLGLVVLATASLLLFPF